MDFLDCRGKSCPQPVLETKRLIEERGPDEVKVAVDNEASRENVRRFLESIGYQVAVDQQEGDFFLVASRMKEETPNPAREAKKIMAFIDAETLGKGDDRLGAILMKSFLMTLKELKPLPWRVAFANGGVKLAASGSELLPHLQELQNLGAEILLCGTCVDFYQLKEQMQVGRISNMFEIISSLTESSIVLKP
jgi:selenium metabolism protein YedF